MLNYIKFLDKRKNLYYNNIVSAVKIIMARRVFLRPVIKTAFTLSLHGISAYVLQRIHEVFHIYYEPSVPFLFGALSFRDLLYSLTVKIYFIELF